MFYLTYAGYELKKWVRDPFARFMIAWPLVLAAIIRFAVPIAEERFGMSFAPYYHVVLAAVVVLVSRVSGAIVAFSILDDRDDNVLFSVRVAPLSMEFYIGLKLFLVYVGSVIASAFAIWFSSLSDVSWGVILGVSAVAALGAPMAALLINVVAGNKVEGFAAIKATGISAVAPIVALFFFDAKEVWFAVEPGFWPAKALTAATLGNNMMRLNYGTYLSVGLAYGAALVLLLYRLFMRRVQ